jgi:L-arabinose isomerase
MINTTKPVFWFVIGSQHLYGPETLRQVAENARHMVDQLNASESLPMRLVLKPVATGTDEIRRVCVDASADDACAGIVAWMHTFSPGKMWIAGLRALTKPLCHFHTQFNRDIPWSSIDMDFMNLNQSAHGGREFGHICARLGKNRKVIVGHWEDGRVRGELAGWMRVANAWQHTRQMKIARFGDNMRQVAVTEGDKVEAQIVFGYEVNTFSIRDLAAYINDASDAAVDTLCTEYAESYVLADQLKKGAPRHESLRDAARIELGLRAFLEDGGFTAYTNTFENLAGMKQLPGIASQRLMGEGYGFGAEGDWKTAALLRAAKVMAEGLDKGTSFMEDYTYHFAPDGNRCLGAHMLEICPSIAASRPRCEVHPLSIGGKEDPVRLVFNAPPGPAINAAVLDMGSRFRMLVNTVDTVEPEHELPKLPVPRALWDAHPDLPTAAASWVYAGGPHHTVFSQALDAQHIIDYAEMAGVECVLIDKQSTVQSVKNELRWNAAAFD